MLKKRGEKEGKGRVSVMNGSEGSLSLFRAWSGIMVCVVVVVVVLVVCMFICIFMSLYFFFAFFKGGRGYYHRYCVFTNLSLVNLPSSVVSFIPFTAR